ncbi:dihydrofolate reductase [Undibacterium sp. LX40W]|uniref:Dihydrofolate reductase n=1 Tax=Undibacterium nitidum TaxID=2762298 RepID=A0A923HQW1_9BURK|nr:MULTISPECIES: dihydrofolate reductase [Undibacterium]MBC3882293.1 dihydrofolate reductase [Undibacterium nitidum]MBC3892574.1 dihydrofolate reductase [Undibacterium sp. LX40W]
MARLSIIVATDKKRGIGINNQLPWHLPEDLAHFKNTTSGHPIIMGRKTYDSIGRPLPKRRNIVVSRNSEWNQTGVETVNSIEQAFALLNEEQAFVIGGAQIYQQAMQLAERLVVTEIQGEYDCDAFFPEIDPKIWGETSRQSFISSNNLAYDIVIYSKK